MTLLRANPACENRCCQSLRVLSLPPVTAIMCRSNNKAKGLPLISPTSDGMNSMMSTRPFACMALLQLFKMLTVWVSFQSCRTFLRRYPSASGIALKKSPYTKEKREATESGSFCICAACIVLGMSKQIPSVCSLPGASNTFRIV